MPEEIQTENSNPFNDERRNIAYGHAIEILIYEGEMLWSILSVFLVVNTILLGFIGQAIITVHDIYNTGSIPCVFGAFIGVLLFFPFYGTFIRNSAYYNFRMEQAKELEDERFPLLNAEGERFSKGKKVSVNGKQIKMSSPARIMANKRAAGMMIFMFLIAYGFAIFYCLPKKNQKHQPTVNKEVKR